MNDIIELNNKGIDVFGGTGFIGSKFCEMYPNDVYIHPRDDVRPIFDNVLYMISTTHNYNVFTDLTMDINTNLLHLMKVLELYKNDPILKESSIFNFISSWFVYGKIDSDKLPAKESEVCNPKGFYSITKKCAEDLVISFCETYELKYRILRLCNVYGSGDKDVSKQKNALQYLINKIKNHEDIELYHNGYFIRDYMYVRDVCRAIYLCLEKGELNTIINVGSGMPQNFREIIDFTMKRCSSRSKIKHIEPTEFHKLVQVKDMYLDISKLKSYGFEQRIDMSMGIDLLLK